MLSNFIFFSHFKGLISIFFNAINNILYFSEILNVKYNQQILAQYLILIYLLKSLKMYSFSKYYIKIGVSIKKKKEHY